MNEYSAMEKRRQQEANLFLLGFVFSKRQIVRGDVFG